MDEFVRLGLTNAAWAAVLALAATAGAWFCPCRPAVVHVLWLLVLIKLVTPSLVRVELPANERLKTVARNEPARTSRAAAQSVGGPSTGKREIPPVAGRSIEQRGWTVAEEPHAAPTSKRLHWRPAVFSFWFAGALAWGAFVAMSVIRFRRLRLAAARRRLK